MRLMAASFFGSSKPATESLPDVCRMWPASVSKSSVLPLRSSATIDVSDPLLMSRSTFWYVVRIGVFCVSPRAEMNVSPTSGSTTFVMFHL